jgi:alpha-tubulin suppressor-like RCC1 family protein
MNLGVHGDVAVRTHCFFISVFLLVSCSVDTEKYTFVDVDGGTGGCVDEACTACRTGFERVGNNQCADVDECEQGLDDCDPAPDACKNRDNGRGYVCECPMGFVGNGIGDNGCIGTTPCAEGTIDLKGDGSECYKPFEAVATGGAHSCGLRGGELHCWGAGDHGQLGLGNDAGDLRVHRTPTQVGKAADWTLIALGARHSCGVQGKALVCFGDNAKGQLGIGTTDDAHEPATVKTDEAIGVLALGSEHSCALQDDLLLCWGSNEQGRAGLGEDAMSRLEPARVGDAGGWVSVAAGARHSCGVRAGEPFCWGDGADNRLGLANDDEQHEPASVDATGMWQLVAAGNAHSCALHAGELYCFGDNSKGQLGVGDTMAHMGPQRVGADMDWSAIALGGTHNCGLRGKLLFCWGDNSKGQLGLGDTESRSEPTAVAADQEWSAIAAGENFSCGLSNGALYCWGDNGSGQLGVGDLDERDSPELVQ